jgi:hypothetical protein
VEIHIHGWLLLRLVEIHIHGWLLLRLVEIHIHGSSRVATKRNRCCASRCFWTQSVENGTCEVE